MLLTDKVALISGAGSRRSLSTSMGKNAEVANVAAFLASDMSSYVTGDRVMCVGGRWM
jgi:NAD(P)-dependent dehydrogenase (short-subunit alcohol dehydrogenase family)